MTDHPRGSTRRKGPKLLAPNPLLALIFAVLFGLTVSGCELTDFAAGDSEQSTSAQAEAESASKSGDRAAEGNPSETSESADEPPSEIEHEYAPAGSALEVAQTLTVKGRAPKTGYSRDQFGPAWKDMDQNGCDQRNDILNRDLTDITHKEGTNNCIVLTGTLIDPFSGKIIHFERGQKTSSAVQIDHVVALSDAWQKGAQQWDQQKREEFANDPLNLLAVDGPLNGQKGDADAATWLPPNKPFRCQYVAQLVGVKHAYSLWVTQAEQDAMVRVLTECPNEPIPTGEEAPRVTATKEAPEKPKVKLAPKSTPAPAKEPKEKPAEDVYYENCTAVWEDIGRPILEGEPGFDRHLDRDGDGVGCESRPR